jgi:hypothetical protein
MARLEVTRGAPPHRASKSIAEFCREHGISRGTFANWRRAGIAPATVQPIARGRVLISEQAERDWLTRYATLAEAVAAASE